MNDIRHTANKDIIAYTCDKLIKKQNVMCDSVTVEQLSLQKHLHFNSYLDFISFMSVSC
jgi:hypothetical protein